MTGVDVLSSIGELRRLVPEWESLSSDNPGGNIFLSPTFALNWLAHFQGRAGLQVLVVREAKKLVGLAPLMARKAMWGRFPVRHLQTLTNHESPCPGLLLSDAAGNRMPEIIEALENSVGSWDILQVDGLGEDEYVGFLKAMFPRRGLQVVGAGTRLFSYLRLEGDWESYLGGRTVNFRRTLRRTERAISARGHAEFVACGKNGGIEEAFETYCRIDLNSWKREDGVVIAGDDGLYDYYRRVVLDFAKAEGSWIFLLLVDGKPVAGIIGLVCHNKLYTLKTSFDIAYSDCSPGTVLMCRVIRLAYEERYEGIDFLGKGEFTERWSRSSRSFRSLTVMRRNPFTLLVGVAKALRGRRPLGVPELLKEAEESRGKGA